jgi:hypothetical protein
MHASSWCPSQRWSREGVRRIILGVVRDRCELRMGGYGSLSCGHSDDSGPTIEFIGSVVHLYMGDRSRKTHRALEQPDRGYTRGY